MSRNFGVISKYTFTLAVDVEELDARLGCVPSVKTFGKIPKNSTKLSDVLSGHVINFLDPSKKSKRWVILMKDQVSSGILSETYTHKCWRCHQMINGQVLGCPIKYVQDSGQSEYYSHIQKKEITLLEGQNIGYYLTVGMFCDWGCLTGYAQDQHHLPEFRESVQLIYKMYVEAGYSGQPLPSPPFTVLKEYGGHLTIQEYKQKYAIDTYKKTGNYYIRMVPIGELLDVSSRF
jgi:hypothetical protein